MNSTPPLNMIVVYVFIFYMTTNIIPGNVEQFKVNANDLKTKEKAVRFDFTKQEGNKWKVIADGKSDDPFYFRFDEKLNFYSFDARARRYDTIPIGKQLKIKKNHKKWRKASEAMIKIKGEDKSVTVKISKTGKKQRLLKISEENNIKLKVKPTLNLSWK